MVNKVLILADNHGMIILSTFPNHRVVGCVKSQVEDMRRLMAFAGNPARQCGRELRIDQKVHAACKTA